MLRKHILSLAGAALLSAVVPAAAALRAPAYPLVTIDPYTSAWSTADNLYDEEVKHWTETPYPLIGVAMVDGEAYRFMGKELPRLSSLLPTAVSDAWTCRYTTTRPAADWYEPSFNDSAWRTGKGAFGSMPQEALARTEWNGPEIWVRREFSVPDSIKSKPLYINYSHDDDVMIYM